MFHLFYITGKQLLCERKECNLFTDELHLDPYARDGTGLYYAAKEGHAKIVEFLIETARKRANGHFETLPRMCTRPY